MDKISVSVVGASGYVGGEILRLILQHPNLEIQNIIGDSTAGEKVIESHPNLFPLKNVFVEKIDFEILSRSDVLFFCLPHNKSGEIIAEFENYLSENKKETVIFDFSADHRLENQDDWDEFYSGKFYSPFFYALPELLNNREEIKKHDRFAVPGCNVTAITLGLQPALKENLIENSEIVAVLANGYSGAGKALKQHLLAAESINSAKPYSIAGVHRHIPEIEQNLAKITSNSSSNSLNNCRTRISFTPTLVPMTRGILATISAPVSEKLFEKTDSNSQNIREIIRKTYENSFENEPFLKLLENGGMPSTASVFGTNYAAIQVDYDEKAKRVLIICAIDNLVRGTAGQAIQTLNIRFSLEETTGIENLGVIR